MWLLSQCEFDHDNEVCCVALNSLGTKVASGTVDGKGDDLYRVHHCMLYAVGYVTVWKVKEEERDFEFQGTYTHHTYTHTYIHT